MTKKRVKTFVIDEPILKTSTLFILGCELEEFKSLVKKRFRGIEDRDLDYDDNDIGTVCTFKKPGTRARVVWIKTWNRKPENIAVLVHELFHLVVRICYDKGIPIIKDASGWAGDEFASYLIEFYTHKCLHHLK